MTAARHHPTLFSSVPLCTEVGRYCRLSGRNPHDRGPITSVSYHSLWLEVEGRRFLNFNEAARG